MSSTEMKSYLSLIPISGHGGVQYGRYGDSDGNLKPAEQKRKLAYHGKGHLP